MNSSDSLLAFGVFDVSVVLFTGPEKLLPVLNCTEGRLHLRHTNQYVSAADWFHRTDPTSRAKFDKPPLALLAGFFSRLQRLVSVPWLPSAPVFFINRSYVQSGLHLHGFLVQCGASYMYSWESLPGFVWRQRGFRESGMPLWLFIA